MNKLLGTLTMATLLLAPYLAAAQSWTYVNYAPESSGASVAQESRISLLVDKGLFGYGHDYGKLGRCADTDCLTFDFMALRTLPASADVGSSYSNGPFTFVVSRAVNISLVGQVHQTLRVDARKDGKLANAYLFDRELGVIAIITPNFDLKAIPESIYFLEGSEGVFAASAGE